MQSSSILFHRLERPSICGSTNTYTQRRTTVNADELQTGCGGIYIPWQHDMLPCAERNQLRFDGRTRPLSIDRIVVADLCPDWTREALTPSQIFFHVSSGSVSTTNSIPSGSFGRPELFFAPSSSSLSSARMVRKGAAEQPYFRHISHAELHTRETNLDVTCRHHNGVCVPSWPTDGIFFSLICYNALRSYMTTLR